MENRKPGSKSEVKKVRSPQDNSLIRTSYYTNIVFKFDGCRNIVTAKVDTGASHTVFGLGHYALSEYTDKIKQKNNPIPAYDASGTALALYGYVVTDFKITEDIVFPKIKIYFSEDIGEKAVLGMDILSLFDFQYLREKRSSNGTFWINNYIDTLHEIEERKLNKDMDYIDPAFIASIDLQHQEDTT